MSKQNTAFEALKQEIEKVPELKNNTAINGALANAQKELDKDSTTFDDASEIFSSLGNAIPKFTYINSTQTDIVSGIFDVTSAVIKVFGMLAKTPAITGPLGAAVGVVGAVIGVFGTSKTTRYYNALSTMVSDAVEKLNDELTKENLSGAISLLVADHNLLVNILSVEHENIEKLKHTYSGFTVNYFNGLAEEQLGKAFEYLTGSVTKSNYGNWAAAADTFYKTTEVIAFKLLCLLEGMSYFMLVENGDTDAESSSIGMQNLIKTFKGIYNRQLKPFFTQPTVTNVALTQHIYRFTEEKFRFVVSLSTYLNETEISFFPKGAKPYKFSCTHGAKHSPKLDAIECIRMTTLNARDNHKNNIFSLRKAIYSSSPIVGFMGDDSKVSEFTHFSIEPVKGNEPPYQEWKIESRNVCTDTSNQYNIQNLRYTLQDIFIFEVFPTNSEIDNSKQWPNKWKYTPDGHTLIVIGSTKEDKVLGDHKGSELKMESFNTFAYEKKHYGSPDQCIWVMFNEKDMK